MSETDRADMCVRYNPFLRSDNIGVAAGFSDAVFRSRFKEKHGSEIEDDMHRAAAEWTGTFSPESVTAGTTFCL